MANLAEKHRATSLDDIVGQEAVISKIKGVIERDGLLGQAFWLSGPSGCGKTTTARILCDMVQPFWDRCEYDAKDVSRDLIRDIEERCRTAPIGCKGWGVTINEAHNLRGDITERLLTTLEKPVVVKHSLWCFTTTDKDLFGDTPFGSRVDPLPFVGGEPLTLSWAIRLSQIAKQENLDGQSLEKYVDLFRRCQCNPRTALRAIGRGEMLVS